MTHQVFGTWAKIILSVPNSRLVLKSKSFISEKVKNKIWGIFQKLGVDSSRIDLLPLLPNNRDHLASYALMDFSLDTFPYAGTTTTCEALYMGIPVITLQSTCHAANVGVSLLGQIEGQGQFVAKNIEEYIKLAVDLANNVTLLQEIRQNLRQKMSESYLCNNLAFTQNVEQVYVRLWKKWCKKQRNLKNNETPQDTTVIDPPAPTTICPASNKDTPAESIPLPGGSGGGGEGGAREHEGTTTSDKTEAEKKQ